MSVLFPDFRSLLIPAIKVANLSFFKFGLDSSTGKPVPMDNQGVDYTGVFTRLNSIEVPTKSGRTIKNSAGEIYELAEHMPAWEFGADCNKLTFKGKAKNEVLTFDPTADEGPSAGVSYATKNWGLGSLLQNAVVFGDNSVLRYRYAGTCANSVEAIATFYIEMDDGSVPVYNADFNFRFSGSASNTSATFTQVGSTNIYRAVISCTESGTGNTDINGVVKSTSNSSKSFTVSGLTLAQDTEVDPGDIPTEGVSLTRNEDKSTNTISEFTGNPDFSILYNIEYKSEGNHEFLTILRDLVDETYTYHIECGKTMLDSLKLATTGSTPFSIYPQIVKLYDSGNNLLYRISAMYGESLVLVDEQSGKFIDLDVWPGETKKVAIAYDDDILYAVVNGVYKGFITIGSRNKVTKEVWESGEAAFSLAGKQYADYSPFSLPVSNLISHTLW